MKASKVSLEFSALITPQQIQADVSFISAQVKPLLSAQTVTVVSEFSQDLLDLAKASVTPEEINSLLSGVLSSLPSYETAIIKAVLDGAVLAVDAAISQYESNAPEVVQYVKALAQGLIDAGL